MSYAYHGNWCGPGWSDGRYSDSVVGFAPAVDEFDETCRQHDFSLAGAKRDEEADLRFVKANVGFHGLQTAKRNAAAALVSARMLADRARYGPAPQQNKNDTSYNMPKQNKNTAKNNNQKTNKNKSQRAATPVMRSKNVSQSNSGKMLTVNPQTAYGSVLTGRKSVSTKLSDDSIAIHTTVCLGKTSTSAASVLPQYTAFQVLSPVSLGNDEIQNMTRVYEQYRITAVTMHYRPIVATSTAGEIIMVSNRDPNYRPVTMDVASSFYQRSLGTEHSLIGPMWMPQSMELAVDTRWKVCDNSNSTTLEEFASGIFFFAQELPTGNLAAGFLVAEVSIEFRGMRFNSRNLISGSYLGFGVIATATQPAQTLGNTARIEIPTLTQGDIYLAVVATVFPPVGATASNLYTLSTGSGSIPYTLLRGAVLYLRAESTTSASMYTTFDAAVGSDVADRLLAGITIATTGPCVYVLTQLRNSAQPNL